MKLIILGLMTGTGLLGSILINIFLPTTWRTNLVDLGVGLYTFEGIFPVDTFFMALSLMLAVELALLIFNIFQWILD